MSDIEDEEQGLVHEAVAASTAPQSPMEALRARRDEIAGQRTVLISIPGFEEMGLKCKYRLVDRHETDEIAKRVKRQTKERSEFMYRVLVDTIITACEGFYLAPDGISDEEADPLPILGGTDQVMTYMQLAQGLGYDPGEQVSQRNAVLFVFGENEFAVGQHGLLLNKWLGNTSADVDEESLEG